MSNDNDPGQDASQDDGLTQRERRRQQFQKNKGTGGPWLTPQRFKGLVIPAVVILVIGGIAAGMYYNQERAGACPPHWHSAFTVYVDGDRVPFNPAVSDWGSFDNPDASGTHIHADDGVYHWHPGQPRCQPWEDGLKHLDVEVTGDSLTLGAPHGPRAGTYEADDVNQLRVFQQKWSQQDDEWVEVTRLSSVLGKQPGNGDGLVIIYGDHTDEEINALLANAASIKGNRSYDPHPA